MPRRFAINCEEEENCFRRLLEFGTAERVMTIQADGMHGKSHFVERLQRICENADPMVPIAIVDCSSFRETQPLGFARAVRKAFGRLIPFSQFDVLVTDFDMKVWNPSARSYAGVVDLREASMDGATEFNVGGVQIVKPNAPVTVQSASQIQLTDEQARNAAQGHCLATFFDEIGEHCAARPAVLVVDTYEQAMPEVRAWLEDELRARVVGDAWPDNLIVVLAGQDVPAFEENWPERHYRERVVEFHGFGRWKPDDIIKGFRDAGFDQPPERVTAIVQLLEVDTPPGVLVELMIRVADKELGS
jgi:hypothetical protein